MHEAVGAAPHGIQGSDPVGHGGHELGGTTHQGAYRCRHRRRTGMLGVTRMARFIVFHLRDDGA